MPDLDLPVATSLLAFVGLLVLLLVNRRDRRKADARSKRLDEAIAEEARDEVEEFTGRAVGRAAVPVRLRHDDCFKAWCAGEMQDMCPSCRVKYAVTEDAT